MKIHRIPSTLCLTLLPAGFAAEQAGGPAPELALKLLMAGNQRYAASAPKHPHSTAVRRKELAKGQHPIAAVLGCSDSRIPPEILFDQGLGDIFVVRSAGNTAGEEALGSLEYAAEHLGVKLILVLGHSRCGAVDATVKGGHAGNHIDKLMAEIQPAVDKVKGQGGDVVDHAIDANIAGVVAQLKASHPTLAELVEQGKIQVRGARYDLTTGRVKLLD